ncbi:MAG: hypothetical protein QOI80_2713 [Solirubrobacteraceae bacterium]|nr:hypothetical protein [Solirubrobacteraceae bacterium]
MAYFADEQEVYKYIGATLKGLFADPELAEKLHRADTTLQYRMHDPESTITIAAPLHGDAQVDCGASELEPEVIMEMQADVAHRFWLGKVNVTVALARGQITAAGPVPKILRLLPLVKPTFPRYRAWLVQAGRKDLAEAD